tara:strand:+ start:204 stop:1535 length:1332 start_codon:yes stop_codon:yes gene_type:complete
MYEISVVGLGFVGLPLLVSISDQNKFFKNIIGIEANNISGNKKIKYFQNKHNNLFFDNKLNKIFRKNKKKIIFSTDYKKASNSDFIFFCFPLHIEKNLKTNLKDYCELISKYYKIAKSGAIFIFNSTSPPGITTQVIKTLKKTNIIRKDVFFVYSPERVTPGLDYYESIVNSHRVFSSNSNSKVSKKVKKLFSIIFNTKKFQVTEFKNYEEAECTKILENSYRAANIALIEEWTILAEKFGIDLFSVIKAIKHRGTHSNIMKPGLGVGGYCLTKDPYFAKFTSNKFLKNKLRFPFVDLTMKINSKMHVRICKEISKLINKNNKIKKILIAGISYAENVDDIRNSRSLDMVEYLMWKKKKLTIYDPVVKILSYKKIKIIKKSKNFNKYDLIIFNVKHKQFKKIDFKKINNKTHIIDTNNILSDYQIKDILKNKIKLKIIGRGDI